jgi:hypothetical protein
VGSDFGNRRCITGAKCVEQLLGLSLELIDVGSIGERARGQRGADHDELLPRPRLSSGRTPGVRSLGQKRVHLSFVRRPGPAFAKATAGLAEALRATAAFRDPASIDSTRWTQSFPRTRKRPDARIEHNKKGRLKAASTYAA